MEITILYEKMRKEFAKNKEYTPWEEYTIVGCSNCKLTNNYYSFKMNNNKCIYCDNDEELPLLIIDDCPLIFTDLEIIKQIENKLDSINVISQLSGKDLYLQYNGYAFAASDPCISLEIRSRDHGFGLYELKYYFDNHGIYNKSSLTKYGRYVGTYDNKITNINILDTLKEVERIM